MDIHREKCKKLKQIRKKLADTLDIDLHQRECTYEGKCSGTCPKCKQEEQQLNRAILKKTALAAGVVTMTVGLTGCVMETEGTTTIVIDPTATEDMLAGEEEYIPPDEIEAGGLEEVTLPEEEQENKAEKETINTEDNTEELYELEGDVVMIEPDTEG